MLSLEREVQTREVSVFFSPSIRDNFRDLLLQRRPSSHTYFFLCCCCCLRDTRHYITNSFPWSSIRILLYRLFFLSDYISVDSFVYILRVLSLEFDLKNWTCASSMASSKFDAFFLLNTNTYAMWMSIRSTRRGRRCHRKTSSSSILKYRFNLTLSWNCVLKNSKVYIPVGIDKEKKEEGRSFLPLE